MVRRQLNVVVLACGLVAVYANAADNNGSSRFGTSANATRGSAGPNGDTLQKVDPPLETGEVKVPHGGVDTSRFDPNAGEGFKGKSSSGGGTIQPRSATGSANAGASNAGNKGATSGAPLSGATAPRGPADTGRGAVARGERGSGKTETNSADTKTGGGAASAGSGSR